MFGRRIVDSVAGTIGRTYDLRDRLTEEVTPEGTVYSYDDADGLTGVTRGTPTVTPVYDNADKRRSQTLPNGIVVEYGFDDDSRLTGL